jgi:hypothetical protein
MKKILLLLLLSIALLWGCGPNDQSVLKKYKTHSPLEQADNRAGIRLNFSKDTIPLDGSSLIIDKKAFQVSFSHPALAFNKSNIELLSGRLFLADAENPSEQLDVKFSTVEQSSSDSEATKIDKLFQMNAEETKTAYLSLMSNEEKEITDRKLKYLLVGFRGIDKSEFAGAETPPCFFLISLDKKNPHLLTDVPLAAGDLFAADSVKGKFIRFAEPQRYSGTVVFDQSKETEITLKITADAAKVTDLSLLTKQLNLDLKNYKKSEFASNSEIEFRTTIDATMQVKVSMYNGNETNTMTFSGGLKMSTPVDIVDDKIELNDVVACDLTVTESCLYGKIKITLEGCATNWVYAVLKNTTTPQEIPQEILTPQKE